MQKKRYWGLALLSIIWMLTIVLINAEAGRTGASATTALWALVSFYAISGNIGAVTLIAKWVSIFQIVASIIFFFVLKTSPDMQVYFGSPVEFAISIGVPTTVWIALYYWARAKSDPTQSKTQKLQNSVSLPTENYDLSSDKITKKQISEMKESNLSNKSDISAEQKSAVNILLEHDHAVRAMVGNLGRLPQEVVESIVIEINNRPAENVIDVRNRVILESLGRPDLVWDDEMEIILRRCRDAKPDELIEFFRVFPVLSKRMAPLDVFKKLITEQLSYQLVVNASGKYVKVVQQGNHNFSLDAHTGEQHFATIDEVYEYLGTPKNKR